ncbi:MAG: hypothetical protein JNK02_05870 [Planctomycetes bacterium]|nr:hypothetical protein [Planctomycetota bacterium]
MKPADRGTTDTGPVRLEHAARRPAAWWDRARRPASALLAVLALAAWLLWIPSGGPVRGDPERASGAVLPPAPDGPAAVLAAGAETGRAERTPAAAPGGLRETSERPPVGGLDLAALLAEIGAAERTGDVAALAALLPRIVGSAQTLRAVAALLEHPTQLAALDPRAAGVHQGASARLADRARHGALVALSVGVARWSRGGGPPDGDGVALTREVLARLPRLDEETRAELVGWIGRSESAGLPALDARYLDAVLELCRADPGEAATYVELLEPMIGDLEGLGAQRATLWGAIASGHAPFVRGFALRALFALDPEAGALAATELLDAARRDPALRSAAAAAIAAGAPPSRAVELLVALRDPSLHAAFAAFAARPEARAAAREHYGRLVAAGEDPTGRQLLVASLRGEDPELLFAIAETDPHAAVRQQAFLTATLAPGEGQGGVRALRAAWERRTDPRLGVPARGVVLAAENVILNGRGPARDEALRLLGDIARDRDLALSERLLAVRTLRPHVPAGSLADLEGLGDEDQAWK